MSSITPEVAADNAWAGYLQNIDYEEVDIDIDKTRRLFEEHINGSLLSSNGSQINVQTLTVKELGSEEEESEEATPQWSTCTSIGSLNESVLKAPSKPFSHHFIVLSQPYSWGMIHICKEGLFRLLSFYAVFPWFLELLRTFGTKIQEQDEHFGIYNQYPLCGVGGPRSTFELCYNLRYPVLRESVNTGSALVWTTRKIGVWAKYDPVAKKTVWILLQPTHQTRFQQRLLALAKRLGGSISLWDVNRLLLSFADRDVEAYISYLESRYFELERMAPRRPYVDEKIRAPSFQDAQSLQSLREALGNLKLSIMSNLYVVKNMSRYLCVRTGSQLPLLQNTTGYEAFVAVLERQQTKMEHYLAQVDSLDARCNILSGLVPCIIALQENDMMRTMQETANQQSRFMNRLTLATAFVIPPMLVLTLFNAGFMNKGPITDIKWALPLFFGLLIILWIIAALVWLWCKKTDEAPDPEWGLQRTDTDQFDHSSSAGSTQEEAGPPLRKLVREMLGTLSRKSEKSGCTGELPISGAVSFRVGQLPGSGTSPASALAGSGNPRG